MRVCVDGFEFGEVRGGLQRSGEGLWVRSTALGWCCRSEWCTGQARPPGNFRGNPATFCCWRLANSRQSRRALPATTQIAANFGIAQQCHDARLSPLAGQRPARQTRNTFRRRYRRKAHCTGSVDTNENLTLTSLPKRGVLPVPVEECPRRPLPVLPNK